VISQGAPRCRCWDRICNEKGSVRDLLGRFGDPAALQRCCEAEPCGFELHKLLASIRGGLDVVVPLNETALAAALADYRASVDTRRAELDAGEAELARPR
jgi:hypothetical protein